MNNLHDSVVLLIPAYQPDETLIHLIEKLQQIGFAQIVIVNDGSEHTDIFSRLAQGENISIVEHEKNLGKGAALKTGFSHVFERLPSSLNTIVTVDADGQHLPEDVLKVAQAALEAPESLILGVRDFKAKAPLKSSIGNSLTRAVLGSAENISLKDTQTGLRAYPRSFAKQTLSISSTHYDFELEIIVLAHRSQLSFKEIPISTVYIDENKSSHFRPLLDSMRIYALFSRFITVSLASFLLDISVFAFTFFLNQNVYVSTYIARAISSSFNFCGNKYFVFKSYEKQKLIRESLYYFALVVLIAMISASLVDNITNYVAVNILVVKVLVDIALFFVNFFLQRTILFRK